jgi:uncharacterized membrane protein YbhN (UPF0104 family)
VRERLLLLGRVGFLALVGAFVAWGFHDRGREVWDAVASTPPPAILAAGALVVVGLLVTSVAWLRLLAGFGFALPGREGRAVFFAGQLGKYIPGSLWSIGAHAELASAYRVPRRVTASTSLAFLGLNMATAGLVVAAARGLGAWQTRAPWWVALSLAVVCAALLTPPVVNRASTLVSGSANPLRLGWRDVGLLVLLMAVTWTSYAGVLVAVVPHPDLGLLPVAAGAFALAYGVGVLVVVAPAGVGAREATLIALLGPITGVANATAIALLTRALHTGGDLLLAAVSWWLHRRAKIAAPAPRSL